MRGKGIGFGGDFGRFNSAFEINLPFFRSLYRKGKIGTKRRVTLPKDSS
jgi:hypothetical protein